MNKNIYETIAERFIRQLEQGTVPWRRPWISAQNLVSQKCYHGVNVFLLAGEERESPWWLTYRQASELGGYIKKGEKSVPVVFWQMQMMTDKAGVPMLNANGKEKIIPFIRWSNVFNLEQTVGVKEPVLSKEPVNQTALQKAQSILDAANLCEIRNNSQSDRAVYIPLQDAIELPSIKRFPNQSDFYHTAFHELCHATGHSSRLHREGIVEKIESGSDKYAREELVAELGASYLSNEAGILGDVTFQNSASYLKSWIQKLKDDPRMIVAACSAAQKACRYIMGERENIGETVKDLIAGFTNTKEKELQNERT